MTPPIGKAPDSYTKLVNQLHQRYGGEIIPPSDSARALAHSGGTMGGVSFVLASLKFQVAEDRFLIELTSDYQMHLHLFTPLKCEFTVRPAGPMSRIQSALGLSTGADSGDRAFDRQFAVDVDSGNARTLLANAEVRMLISSLPAFAYLKFRSHSIHLNRDVDSDEQLTITRIEALIFSLARLKELAASSSK